MLQYAFGSMMHKQTSWLLILLLLHSPIANALQISSTRMMTMSAGKPKNILVTGAGSSVGKQVFKKLLKKPNKFVPFALVRNNQDAQELVKLGAKPDHIRIGDIVDKSSIQGMFKGIDKAVLCTSATPQKSLTYKIKNFFRSMVGKQRPPKINELYYLKGQSPYFVDFIGQKHVVDEAIASGSIEHIVMLSNMGGYRNLSRVNDIGRDSSDPNSGNLFKWKRAAERYLMRRCFFTIVHAGALTDEPGGRRDIVWDNDDALLRTNFRNIPKEDCAEVLIQALQWKEAIGRSIDVATRGEGTGPTKDWLRFWSIPGNNMYPADLEI